jgi:hypothetical protein
VVNVGPDDPYSLSLLYGELHCKTLVGMEGARKVQMYKGKVCKDCLLLVVEGSGVYVEKGC